MVIQCPSPVTASLQVSAGEPAGGPHSWGARCSAGALGVEPHSMESPKNMVVYYGFTWF